MIDEPRKICVQGLVTSVLFRFWEIGLRDNISERVQDIYIVAIED